MTEKDIRVLKFGGICVAAMLVIAVGFKFQERWSSLKSEISKKEAQLDVIDVDKAKQAGVMSIVPVFEMPLTEEEQKNRFREELTKQLSGIKHEPLKIVSTRKTLQKNYRLLNVQCTAKCKFTQVLDLLAKLNANPYLVGIEEFKMQCDKAKPQEVTLHLTVSTAVRIK